MSKQELFKASEGVINWLDMPQGKLFRTWLLDKVEAREKTLRRSGEEKDIFRSQGAIEDLVEILNLRKELLEHKERTGNKNGNVVQK